MSEDAVVLFAERPLEGGGVLAEAVLNVPATLNSLSLEMIDLLQPALDGWRARDDVKALLIKGAGGRAFCAGGDIQALYHAIKANHAAGEVVDTYPFEFFEREYRLDYALHTFPKPVIVLGHGVVMGGGLGILSAASHRVLTERSRVAIPEITIGLFPDAGTTWLLRQMPEHLAVFAGMTGSHLGAADAMLCGVGTVLTDSSRLDALDEGLNSLALGGSNDANHQELTDYLAGFAAEQAGEAQLTAVPATLNVAGDLPAVVASIEALQGTSEWVDRGVAALRAGCPTSIGVVHEQIRRTQGDMTLADAFRMEMIVATHCAQNPDFAEGVRALLIDKDNAPAWRYPTVAELPDEYVQSHFEAPWPANPLEDLGRNA